jgi:hypothetical protein
VPTVFRVDLDTQDNDYRTRRQIRALSPAHAEMIYASILSSPPADYETVSLVYDCRTQRQQMLHGDQEVIS